MIVAGSSAPLGLALRAIGVGPKVANIGPRLDYFFGKARGRIHNPERSADILRKFQRIGLPDTAASRAFLESHLNSVLNNASNIVRVENGIVVRGSFVMGAYGGGKFETFWDGDKLLSGKLISGL